MGASGIWRSPVIQEASSHEWTASQRFHSDPHRRSIVAVFAAAVARAAEGPAKHTSCDSPEDQATLAHLPREAIEDVQPLYEATSLTNSSCRQQAPGCHRHVFLAGALA